MSIILSSFAKSTSLFKRYLPSVHTRVSLNDLGDTRRINGGGMNSVVINDLQLKSSRSLPVDVINTNDSAELKNIKPLNAIDNDRQPDKWVALGELYLALDEMNDDDLAWLDQNVVDISSLSDYDYENLKKFLPHNPTDYEQITYAQFIEGLTKLAASGVAGITDIISALHCELLLRPIGLYDDNYKQSWKQSIIGKVYSTVRDAVMIIGNNLSSGVRNYNQKLDEYNLVSLGHSPLPYHLKLLLNGLNGVMGDHLVNQDNPLAVKMALYNHQGELQHGELSGCVNILVHGLCMSHYGWNAEYDDSLGSKLNRQMPGCAVLYLDYNTGRRIADNGRQLSCLLNALVKKNSNITRINLIGHSMGGLVSRSALFYGEKLRHDWMYLANTLITLGSPHQGSILEQTSNYVLQVLNELPFASSLSKLADVRSAGIIDLRHGSIQDADWKSLEGRTSLPQGFLNPAPLPKHVHTYAIAGTLMGGLYNSSASNLVGDGLVHVESAFAQESEDEVDVDNILTIPDGHKAIFYGVGHINLLYNDRVHQQVINWLKADVGEYAFKPLIHSYEEPLKIAV